MYGIHHFTQLSGLTSEHYPEHPEHPEYRGHNCQRANGKELNFRCSLGLFIALHWDRVNNF